MGARARSGDEQRVDPLHIGRRILELAAFGEQRLVEEDVREGVEMRAAVEALDERMLDVDLERRLAPRRRLPGLLQEPREVTADVAFLDHEAGRRVDQARRDAAILYAR